MIKLFAWESKILGQLNKKRETELIWLRRNETLNVIMTNVEILLPMIAMLASFGTYVSVFIFFFTPVTRADWGWSRR